MNNIKKREKKDQSNLQDYRNQWKKDNMLGVSVFLKAERVLAFRQKCAEYGIAQSRLISLYIDRFLKMDKERTISEKQKAEANKAKSARRGDE